MNTVTRIAALSLGVNVQWKLFFMTWLMWEIAQWFKAVIILVRSSEKMYFVHTFWNHLGMVILTNISNPVDTHLQNLQEKGSFGSKLP